MNPSRKYIGRQRLLRLCVALAHLVTPCEHLWEHDRANPLVPQEIILEMDEVLQGGPAVARLGHRPPNDPIYTSGVGELLFDPNELIRVQRPISRYPKWVDQPLELSTQRRRAFDHLSLALRPHGPQNIGDGIDPVASAPPQSFGAETHVWSKCGYRELADDRVARPG